MKFAIFLITIFSGADAFGVAPPQTHLTSTALNAIIPEDQMTESRKEIFAIQQKWNEVRLLDREEARSTLEGEWLEAYNRYYEKYDDDMTRMTEIATKVAIMISPPQIKKKSKGQRKRDAYASKLARDKAHGVI